MIEKIYCGNGKIVSTQYGDMTKLSLSKDDINKMVSYMKENKLDWINLNFKEKKEPQPGKSTHYLEVDTWKPKTDFIKDANFTPDGKTTKQRVMEMQPPLPEEDDLPF